MRENRERKRDGAQQKRMADVLLPKSDHDVDKPDKDLFSLFCKW